MSGAKTGAVGHGPAELDVYRRAGRVVDGHRAAADALIVERSLTSEPITKPVPAWPPPVGVAAGRPPLVKPSAAKTPPVSPVTERLLAIPVFRVTSPEVTLLAFVVLR